jgi:uncharacterized membrane protein
MSQSEKDQPIPPESNPLSDASTTPARPKTVRTRIFEGLLMALPVALTIWIIYWLYTTLRNLVIDPIAALILWLVERDAELVLPWWFEQIAAPLIALLSVIMLLFVLGIFFHSSLHRAIDVIMMRLPLVAKIYSAVRKVFSSLEAQRDEEKFKRVVLVQFPHPGMRVPAFVTSSCRDVSTGKKILCVYVPTTPVPTSGYMLLVPEEDVIEITWDLNETLQAIISGGISVPDTVEYYGVVEPDADRRTNL